MTPNPASLWLFGVLLTFLVAYGGVAALHHWALRSNLIDLPNTRSSHTRPTPRGGGLVIAACTLVAVWPHIYGATGDIPLVTVALYTVSALMIAIVSWYDDLYSLSNRLRFSVHVVAALMIVTGVTAWRIVTFPLIGNISLGWFGIPISLLWLIGLTNAYNFMDGIDGLAGGQAVIAGAAWACIGWSQRNIAIATLGILIAASSAGFLLHNWPPARIFMGDVGSAFLGFSFAALALMGGAMDPRLAVVGVVVVWPFIFDTIFTLLRRWRHGENIFEAHRSHLYQRLVIAGLRHRNVTLLYLALAIISCVSASLWLLLPAAGGWLLLLWLIASASGTWLYVQRIEANVAQLKNMAMTTSQPELH